MRRLDDLERATAKAAGKVNRNLHITFAEAQWLEAQANRLAHGSISQLVMACTREVIQRMDEIGLEEAKELVKLQKNLLEEEKKTLKRLNTVIPRNLIRDATIGIMFLMNNKYLHKSFNVDAVDVDKALDVCSEAMPGFRGMFDFEKDGTHWNRLGRIWREWYGRRKQEKVSM